MTRSNAGRGGGTTKDTYSLPKGIAGGIQKGLTDIAKKGGSSFAWLEDIQYVPMEMLFGQEIGTFSDKGPMNLWNDSIQREADAVEDYYADNVVAGGWGAELLDKTVSKAVSLIPSVAVDFFTHGAGTASELESAAANRLPGISSSFRTVTEKLAKDPAYWLSVAGTTGERYEDAMKELEGADAGNWVNAVGRSVGESLYKEAIGTNGEIPDILSALAEIAYKMYEEKHAEESGDSLLSVLAQLFLK